jgi:hypothetical protein
MARKTSDRDAVTAGMGDILGNVIRTDQQRSGRGMEGTVPDATVSPTPPTPPLSEAAPLVSPSHDGNDTKSDAKPEIMTSHNVIEKTSDNSDNRSLTQHDNVTLKHSDNMTSNTVTSSELEETPAQILERRVSEAQQMAKSRTKTATIRIPIELDKWLNTYHKTGWELDLKKGKLVTEALMMLYARRGAPEKGELGLILPTELLSSDFIITSDDEEDN